jgi:hypothetical protein
MKITINKESLVESIQDQFNGRYPFLKIEFLKRISNKRSFSKMVEAEAAYAVVNLPGFLRGGVINIDPKQTIACVERNFEEQIGVLAFIFRKSGNVWIETIFTDNWTLEQQNKEGEQLSSHFKKK